MEFIVDDVFVIKEKGLVAVCRHNESVLGVKTGDLVEIISPEKTSIKTKIDGIDAFNRQCFTESTITTIGFLFKENTHIPIGSIIRTLK